MNRTRSRVAIAGLAAGAIATYIVSCSTPEYEAENTLCADFADAAGLYTGNGVAVLGVPVGTIVDIASLPDRVRVSMRIPTTVRLPENVAAITVSDSVLTNRHIELTPAAMGGAEFDRKSCIPMDHTRTPKSTSELYSSADRLAQALDGNNGSLGVILHNVAGQLDGKGSEVRDLVHQAADAVGDPYARDQQLRTLADNLDAATADLTDNAAVLQDALRNAGPTIDVVSQNIPTNIRSIVEDGVDFSPVLGRIEDDYHDPIVSMADQAVPIVHAAVPLAGPINTILRLLPGANRSVSALLDVGSSAFPRPGFPFLPALLASIKSGQR